MERFDLVVTKKPAIGQRGDSVTVLSAEMSNGKKIRAYDLTLLCRPHSLSAETPGRVMTMFTYLEPGRSQGKFFQLPPHPS